MSYRRTLVGALILGVSASLTAQPLPETNPAPVAQAAEVRPVSGIDLSAVDKGVRPQDDFFQYVNGTWLKTTEIPSDKSRYSMFNVLNDETQENLKAIILDASKSEAKAGSNQQKLGDMYRSFMDEDTCEELGMSPIKEELDSILGVESHAHVAARLGEMTRLQISGPLGFYVYPDAKDPTRYGFWMGQDGLTLPDRDYYLKQEEKFVKHRADLKKYVADLLAAADYPD